MKTKKLVTALCVSATVMISAVAAYAEDVYIETDVYQPDEICGYISIKPSTDADVYVKIYKHTPETVEEGYIVYDSVISADKVHVDDKYVYKLEYNNFNAETKAYEGSYDIMVGVHKHADSILPEDIVYNKLNLVVEDTNYSGVETFCNINISLTDENLAKPLCVEGGEKYNKTYDMTFSYLTLLPGDVTGDGKVNVRDASAIASKLALGKTSELSAAADFNSDGKVNVRDAAAIALMLATKSNAPTEDSTETTKPSVSTEPAVTTALTTAATDPTETTQTSSSANPSATTVSSDITGIMTLVSKTTTATTIISEVSSDSISAETTLSDTTTETTVSTDITTAVTE